MILLIDPDVSYLDHAKEVLKAIGFKVLTTNERHELIRLYCEFRDEIDIIAFDSYRVEMEPRLMAGMQYLLRMATFSMAQCLEWNLYDWKEKRNVESSKYH